MATIDIPSESSTHALAVQIGQALRLHATATTSWWIRNLTTGGPSGTWGTAVATGTDEYVLDTSLLPAVTNRLTFDRLQIAVSDPSAPPTSFADGLHVNLVEGPVTVLHATTALGGEAQSGPPLRPWDGEDDDPALGEPLVMPAANRDGLGTEPLETASTRGGPVNVVRAFGRGIFVDTAGKVGVRVPFTTDVRGLGPFPAIASYHHGGLYFQHDQGRSRTLGLTRVLYEDADGNVAVVRGDGRRNTYRLVGVSTYEAARSLQTALTVDGSDFVETTSSGRKYRYLSDGRLDRVVDYRGSCAYYSYDSNDRLQKIRGASSTALGLVPYLSYDGSGLLSRLVLEDPNAAANNRTTYFTYDVNGNLEKIVGAELCVTYFGYDLSGRLLTSVSDPDGFTWQVGYSGDRVDRVVDAATPAATTYYAHAPGSTLLTQKDRASKVTYFSYGPFGGPERIYNLGTPADYHAYDSSGNLVSSKTRLGHTWSYEYDAQANRIAATDPVGGRSYFAYDSNDLLRVHVDPLLRSTYLAYDGQRNLTTRVDALGQPTYFEFEPLGLLRQRKDRRGALTYMGYDARGNVDRVVDGNGFTTYLTHDSANELVATTDPLGRTSVLVHDKRGRVVKSVDPLGVATYLAFDGRCNLVSQVDALLRTTTMLYDGNGNRTKTIDALGNQTYMAYDPEERPSLRLNARLNPTYWHYDALGRRQRQVDALLHETYFAYDEAHQLDRQVDARGSASYLRYDSLGRPTHQKDALFHEAYMGYDAASQRVLTIDKRGKSSTMEYDRRGWLQRTVSPVGAVSYMAHDLEGNRVLALDARQKPTYFTYDLGGRLTHTKSAIGGLTYTGYDSANQSILRIDELGAPTYTAYDAAGRVQTTRDPAGHVSYFTHDLVGNRTAESWGLGWGQQTWGSRYGGERATTYHAYDPVNRRQSSTDPYGARTYMAYDVVGNVERSIDERGFATYFTYDALDRRTHTKDPVHFASSYLGYDEVGNTVLQADPQGYSTYMTYDRLNRVSFSHDRAGLLTYHRFDEGGNRTEQQLVVGAEERWSYFRYDDASRLVRQVAADGGETYFELDLNGQQVRVVDPMGRPTYMTYDDLNRLSTRSNAFGETSTTTYDLRSSALRRIDPVGRTTYMAYDLPGRLLHQSNALGEFSYFGYDTRGNRVRVTNPRNFSTYFRFDLKQRLTGQTDALGGRTYLGYDVASNKILQVDELGNPTYFAYDGLGRLSRSKDALLAVTYMGYDSRSSSELRVDADGRATYMAHDPAARLERTWFANPVVGEAPDAPIYYGYDQVGNVLAVDDALGGLGVSTFDHDRMDRLTKKTTIAGAVYYAYDVSGRKITLKDPDLRENVYVYDAAGRLNRVVIDALNASYYEYDGSGLVTRRAMPTNAVISYFTYEAATARLKQLDVRNAAGSLLAYFAYQRNANGMEAWTRREDGLNIYYTYDALDRLTREDYKGASATLYGFGYGYDAASNRTVKQSLVAAANTYYSYDANSRLQQEVVAQTGVTTEYEYDLSRRAKVRHSPTVATYFTHNQRSETTALHFAGVAAGPHYLSYDGVGERVRIRTGSSETYLAWDHRKLLQERTPGGTVLRRYRSNDGDNDRRGYLIVKADLEFGELYVIYDGNGNVFMEGTLKELRSFFGEVLYGALPNGQRVAMVPDDLIRLDAGQQLQSSVGGSVTSPPSDWKTVTDPPADDPRDGQETPNCGPEVTEWLLREMVKNAGAPGLKQPNPVIGMLYVLTGDSSGIWDRFNAYFADKGVRYALFKSLVETTGDWDFKSSHTLEEGDCPTRPSKCDNTVTLCGLCFHKHVTGNIHYGFVGSMFGIRDDILSGYAGAAQEAAAKGIGVPGAEELIEHWWAGGEDQAQGAVQVKQGLALAKKYQETGTIQSGDLCGMVRAQQDQMRFGATAWVRPAPDLPARQIDYSESCNACGVKYLGGGSVPKDQRLKTPQLPGENRE